MSDQQRTLAWLDEALQLEERGRIGYRKAAAEAGDPLAEELFSRLAELEDEHTDKIKEIFRQISQKQLWPDQAPIAAHPALTSKSLRSWFLEPLAKNKGRAKSADTLAAVRIGADFEAAAVKLYQAALAALPSDSAPGERNFLAAMIREEQVHLGILNELELYYRDPESWSLEMDHAILDGG